MIDIKNASHIASKFAIGPIALIRNEDNTNLEETVSHQKNLGFPNIAILTETDLPELPGTVGIKISNSMSIYSAINALMDQLAGRWIFAAHNAEYLYYPFNESRSVMDLLQFVNEERRDSVFCNVLDLYPSKIMRGEDAYSDEDAWFDTSGYYSIDRYEGPHKLARQIDVFGGLRWRYAEHIPWEKQRINRTALFRAKAGLRVDENGIFSEPEYNTVSCPWHNNLTAAVASFRAAKSLLQNPGSTFEIESLVWENSKKFDWTAKQLMEHGMIEPGQWF